MNEDHSSPVDIDELRRRWEAEPTPQLSLQLAEEYRRAEETDEAISILETALDSHPEHVAARVALGRYRMDAGRHEEARPVLEAVVAEDPTHLVANRALVHLYADLGDEKQARDRLDLYKLLNEGDPAIEELERKISGEGPLPEPTPETPSESTLVSAPPPDLDFPVVTSTSRQEPFAGLGARVTKVAYWEAVGSEGIFPIQIAAAAVAVAIEPVAELVAEPVGEAIDQESAPEPEPEGPEPEVEMATVTLANLYLEQGHLDDAERGFQDVLAREPGNSEAVEGLESVLRRRAEPATEDVEDRKITMLKSYLERFRSSEEGN
jgi:tetratricopeptide (TPR) repeat protein